MIITVNENMFRDAFVQMNRAENFSSYGLGRIFAYLENYEQETGENVGLDVIAICCEFSEFESVKDVQENYDIDIENAEDDADIFDIVKEYLEEHTSVICFEDDCIVIADF